MISLCSRNTTTALPLLAALVMEAPIRESRGGTKTRELTMVQLELTQPLEREVLTPHRHASYPAQIAETLWVLAGRNDVGWLSHYLPRAKDFSDDGKTWRAGYGPRLRAYDSPYGEAETVDQLDHVVQLLREDRTTRRAVISLYDPHVDTQPGKDIPCNNWLHFLARDGRLDLHIATRSNDLIWGWSGINSFEWSVLLELVASLTGLAPGSLHFSISSLHIYERHWEKAVKISTSAPSTDEPIEDMARPARSLPPIGLHELSQLDNDLELMFRHEAAIRNGEFARPHLPQSPLFREWLLVLENYWNGPPAHAALSRWSYLALQESPKRPASKGVCSPVNEMLPGLEKVRDAGQTLPRQDPRTFVGFVDNLHREKSAAYGDSWKRRGEMLGIMANIARKVDRLGQNGAGETAADTAIDLVVYLLKYHLWIEEEEAPLDHHLWLEEAPMDHHLDDVLVLLEDRESRYLRTNDLTPFDQQVSEEAINRLFEHLEKLVSSGAPRQGKLSTISGILDHAYPMARILWCREQESRQWKAGNEKRFWKGYEADVED